MTTVEQSVSLNGSGFGEEIVLIEDDEPKFDESPVPETPVTPESPEEVPVVESKPEQEESTPVVSQEVQPVVVKEEPKPVERPVEVEDEKKTDDPEPAPIAMDETVERDFDTNPTDLYKCIQHRAWQETVLAAKANPEEASIWVSRKEPDGRMRWRLLPIHAAIIFKAPEMVVEALLAAYPQGAQSKDDQGMLPLHLAFRNGSSEGVVNLLLVAYPQSVDIQDRKGRIPLVLAQASTSPNREAFMRALERGPTYYAVAAAATERAAVTAEQRAIFDAKLMQVRQAHQHELSQVKIEAETKQQALQLRLAAMEKELAKTQETSQVLVDHVNSLEAQLASRSDTERFLATKIANLDSSLKDTTRTREELEASLKTDLVKMTIERDDAVAKLGSLEAKYKSAKEQLEKSLSLFDMSEKDFRLIEKKLKDQVKDLELDLASERANTAILDSQLKKKIENEHGLASQVSALAGKLAESAAEARDSTKTYANRTRALEEERQTLRESVHDLTKRLSMVARVLEQMVEQQAGILKEAKNYEDEMSGHAAAHAKIVGDAMRQEMQFEKAKEEREQIRLMLAAQEENVQASEGDRVAIMDAIAIQGQHMENSKKSREELMSNVESMSTEITGVLSTVLDGIPRDADKDGNGEELVDSIVKKITNSDAEDKTTIKSTSQEVPATPSRPPTGASQQMMTPRTTQEQNEIQPDRPQRGSAPTPERTIDVLPNDGLVEKQSAEESTAGTDMSSKVTTETVPEVVADEVTTDSKPNKEAGLAPSEGDRIEAARGSM